MGPKSVNKFLDVPGFSAIAANGWRVKAVPNKLELPLNLGES